MLPPTTRLRPTPSRSDPPLGLSDDQRAGLVRTKLAALVRDLAGDDLAAGSPPQTVGAHAALVADGTAYLLAPDPSAASLAGALVWADRAGADRLVVFVDDDAGGATGATARMAEHFVVPVEVRTVAGATSAPAVAADLPAVRPADDDPALRALLEAEGLEVVVEQGTVRGEVLGLEVARLVRWPESHGGDGALHLEAGVGRFDRDAVAEVHPDEPPQVALARAVSMVRGARHPGAAGHPMARLARDRWLRVTVCAAPASVGAAALAPAESTVVRSSVRDLSPAVAVGTGPDGEDVVVACTAGVDLSLVPVAADARALHRPGARLVLAVPARDRLPSVERLAAHLRRPAEVVAVDPPWGTA